MGNLDVFIEYQIHVYIDRIILPILFVLGITGNVLIIIVLVKPKNRNSSTALLLLALAISDISILLTGLPHKWLDTTFGINIREFSELGCKVHLLLTIQAGQLSGFYIVAISAERFVFILLPYRAKVICSLRNTKLVILSIPLISFILSAHLLYGAGLSESGKCSLRKEIYINGGIWRAWQVLNIVGVLFVPSIMMAITNTCIIVKLVFGNCTFKQNLNTNQKQKRLAVKKKSSQVTGTLMIVIMTFMICVIPIGVYYVMYSGDQWEDGISHHDARILLFWSGSSALFHTNNAVNFFIYFLSGSNFRKEIKYLFCSQRNEAVHIKECSLSVLSEQTRVKSSDNSSPF